jgi:pimeloyl-ACP methyl ester carboxylesterase
MKRLIWLALCVFMIPLLSVRADDLTPQDLADPDGRFIQVNGAQVYYIERGSADSPSVLLLHGFLGSTVNWDNVIDPLAKAGFHVIAFDRPPFGLSDKSPDLDYSLKAQAALTAGLMDALHIHQAALVGHSAGGQVAAEVALLYPDRVTKLVLVDAAIGLTEADMSGSSNQENAQSPYSMFANVDPKSPLAQLAVRNLFTSDFGKDLLKKAYHNPERVKPEQFERSIRPLKLKGWEAGFLAFVRDMTEPDSDLELDSLKDLSAPTLLIWGEDDEVVPIRVGERLREALSNPQWITYPDVGHMAMDEHTQQFNADVTAFLKQEGRR